MTWHLLCDRSDLETRVGHEFVVDGRVVAVFADGEQLFAVDGMCAHQGGPIAQGVLNGKCVTCPWHGWQYDISNGCNMLTGKRMLDCFPLEIRDGHVWVELP